MQEKRYRFTKATRKKQTSGYHSGIFQQCYCKSTPSAKGVAFKAPVGLALRVQQKYLQLTAILPRKKKTLREGPCGSCGIWCWLAAAWRLATRAWKSRVCEWRRSIAWAKLLKSIPVVGPTAKHGAGTACAGWLDGGWWLGGWMDASWLGGWMDANVLFPNHRGPLPKLRPFSELRNLIVTW